MAGAAARGAAGSRPEAGAGYLSDPAAGAVPPPNALTGPLAAAAEPVSGEPGLRLLLVEDNDINQTVALGILSQFGYTVDVAGDGLQAVTMAGQRAYDAILMDCQMPRLDGYAATVELRKKPATRTTPIIAMTAATFAADGQRCLDSGMDDFIAKPVRAATLHAVLNRWLPAGGTAPRPRPADAGWSDQQAAVEPVTAARDRSSAVHALPVQGAPVTGAASAGTVAGVAAAGPAGAGMPERIAELLGDGSAGEVELVREIIGSFLGRTVDLLQRLTLAVDADDAESARLHAHSLVGAGLNLAALEVVRISRQIGADALSGRLASSGFRLVELEVALEEARVVLRDQAPLRQSSMITGFARKSIAAVPGSWARSVTMCGGGGGG